MGKRQESTDVGIEIRDGSRDRETCDYPRGNKNWIRGLGMQAEYRKLLFYS